ncbi:MAG: hypothetical protein MUF49_28525 [Oculatellaceae cyanobacterium Prado106]|nr:hypothetical protein [Oculatellaceae cyanobacterium Prado106]
MPDIVYLLLLLIAPTLLVWRWNWLGVWLGALTLAVEIVVLILLEQRNNLANLDWDDFRLMIVGSILGLLYCLFVISCKSWYRMFRSR